MSKRKIKRQTLHYGGIGVDVPAGNLNYALREFKKQVKESGVLKEYMNRQEYKKPSKRRREEIVNAIYRKTKENASK